MEYAIYFLIAVVVSLAITSMAVKQSRLDDSKPLGLGEFDYPTADAARAISYVAGRVQHTSVNIFYAGNYSSRTITDEINSGSGLFATSENVVVGYAYRMRIAFSFCYGPGVVIHGMTSGDFRVFEDVDFVGGSLVTPNILTISAPGLYIQDNGGIILECRFYGGFDDQAEDQTFKDVTVAGAPGYRNVSYIVTDDSYWGNMGRIEPMKWEISRYPDPLVNGNGWEKVPDGNGTGKFDANPAYILYELFTNTLYGAAIPNTLADVSSFELAGETLFNEGFGLSIQIDVKATARNTVDEIMKHIGGIYLTDPTTGKLAIRLIRGDFDTNTIPHYTDDQIVMINEYGQASLENLNTEFKVTYTDRYRDYTQQVAPAYNAALVKALNRPNSVHVPYLMVSNQTLANRIAWRELRVVSFAPSSLSMTMTREAYDLIRGDVIKISSVQNDISELVVRVKAINYGDATAEHITVDATEEVLTLGEAAFIIDDENEFETPDPTDPTTDIPGTRFVEAPRMNNLGFAQRYYQAGGVHVWAFVLQPNQNTTGFKYRINGNVEYHIVTFLTRHLTAATIGMNENSLLTYKAQPWLHPNGSEATIYHDSTGSSPTYVMRFSTNEAEMIGRGHNVLMMFDPADPSVNEVIGVGNVIIDPTDVVGDIIVFDNISRGLLDTIPRAWPAGTEMWYMGTWGGAENITPLNDLQSNELAVIGSSHYQNGFPDQVVGAVNYTPYGRYTLPTPPKRVKINNVAPNNQTQAVITITSVATGLDLTWENTNKLITTNVHQISGEMGDQHKVVINVYDDATDTLIVDSDGNDCTYQIYNDEATSDSFGLNPGTWSSNVHAILDKVLQADMTVTLRIEVQGRVLFALNPEHMGSKDTWIFLVDVAIPA